MKITRIKQTVLKEDINSNNNYIPFEKNMSRIVRLINKSRSAESYDLAGNHVSHICKASKGHRKGHSELKLYYYNSETDESNPIQVLTRISHVECDCFTISETNKKYIVQFYVRPFKFKNGFFFF